MGHPIISTSQVLTRHQVAHLLENTVLMHLMGTGHLNFILTTKWTNSNPWMWPKLITHKVGTKLSNWWQKCSPIIKSCGHQPSCRDHDSLKQMSLTGYNLSLWESHSTLMSSPIINRWACLFLCNSNRKSQKLAHFNIIVYLPQVHIAKDLVTVWLGKVVNLWDEK